LDFSCFPFFARRLNFLVEIRLEEETVWLAQSQMAELFEKGRCTVAEHIAKVCEEDEQKQGQYSKSNRASLDLAMKFTVI